MALFQVIVGALLAAATIASSFASFIDAIVFAAPLLATLLAPLLAALSAALPAALSAPRLRGFSIHLYQEGRMDALNVSTRRQLEDLLQQMVPLFEGDETEQNWLVREKAVKRLQRLAWGDAPHRFPKVYVAGMKTLLDGILKAVNSLRTTLSANGCKLVQDIAISAGSGWTGGLDPSMIDILLQNLIKLCCNTKNLAAENGNATVITILTNVPYSARLLQHIWHACDHKNAKPRTYGSGWLKTILTKHGHHKNTLEHAGGIELIEKCIRKGLGDANPGVREGMRGTFWAFTQLWPERSQVILHALDTKQQGLLAKHPANPNPTTNNPTTATKPASSSLKDTIAAHKRAKATGIDLPLRPRTVITTKATGEESTQHASVGVGIDLPLRPQSIVTTKATGEESTQHASVAGDTAWVDDLFIEKPVKAVSKPQPQQDSIFGAKRAKDAQETPQNDEQLPKDVERLLVGPRRRPRKPPVIKTVVRSAEDVCFIKPKKKRTKAEEEAFQARVRPSPILESSKPTHFDRSQCISGPNEGETQLALTGLLSQRLDLDDDSLAAIKLEDDLEVAIEMCKTQEAICTIVEFLETEHYPTRSEKCNVSGLKSTALYALAYLLRRQGRETKEEEQAFTDEQALPLATLAQRCMHDDNVQVRAATIEYCIHLYATTTASQFWRISEGDESLEALIWYHLQTASEDGTR